MIIEIDARGLQPPEPFERVIAALERFQPGDEIVLLLHRYPQPLFNFLTQNGYQYRVANDEDGTFRISITA